MNLSRLPFGQTLNQPAAVVARRLLGSELVRELDGQQIRLKIVETEAYDATDAASHSYRGQTARTAVMFGPAGHLYVYFTYGLHYCANIVTGARGEGSAVLLRAAEPLSGQADLEARRGKTGLDVTNGPAKLCQALGIDHQLNGHNLADAPLRLELRAPLPTSQIRQTTRIGLRQAQATPWRFYILNNPYVSSL